MESSDKAISETGSEREFGELQEEWPIVSDEVHHLETVKGATTLEVLDNRRLHAPQYDAKLARFYAAWSNRTAATCRNEGWRTGGS